VYAKIFSTGTFHIVCQRWNERVPAEQTWNDVRTHVATSYRQHNQMYGGTSAASGYFNAAVAQPTDDDLVGAAIDALANLATATAVERVIVATLTEASSHLTKQLEDTVIT
jgi:hypothetical protein